MGGELIRSGGIKKFSQKAGNSAPQTSPNVLFVSGLGKWVSLKRFLIKTLIWSEKGLNVVGI